MFNECTSISDLELFEICSLVTEYNKWMNELSTEEFLSLALTTKPRQANSFHIISELHKTIPFRYNFP